MQDVKITAEHDPNDYQIKVRQLFASTSAAVAILHQLYHSLL